jgi:hypothetical protein
VTLERVETTRLEYPLEEYSQNYPFHCSDDELPNLGPALAHHYPSDDVRRWVGRFLDPSGITGTMSLLRSITLGVKEDFVPCQPFRAQRRLRP